MINRRKFVALLSSVPVVGKTVLAAYVKPEDQSPPGFVQCNACGEFNGSTDTLSPEESEWAYRVCPIQERD